MYLHVLHKEMHYGIVFPTKFPLTSHSTWNLLKIIIIVIHIILIMLLLLKYNGILKMCIN